MAVERIDATEARRHVESQSALLVCAYDDEEKCNQVKLDGSVSMTWLRSTAASLRKDREIIFYCA